METADAVDRSWMARAACKGLDPNMWFEAVINEPSMREKNTLAQSICQACEVRYDCLEYSLYHERYGIWGGYTTAERHEMRRERNIEIIAKRLIIS